MKTPVFKLGQKEPAMYVETPGEGHPASPFNTWCIVSTGEGFVAREVTIDRLNAGNVVAVHPDKASAEAGLARVTMMRGMMEPTWRDAIARTVALSNRMIAALHEAAKPRPDDEAAK